MYMHRQGQAIALTPTESHTHALRVEPHMGRGSLTCSHGTSSSCNSHTLTRESFEVSTEAQQIVAHTYVCMYVCTYVRTYTRAAGSEYVHDLENPTSKLRVYMHVIS